MPTMIVSTHRDADRVQVLGNVCVSSRMFTQPVNNVQTGSWCLDRPFAVKQGRAILCDERAGVFGHGGMAKAARTRLAVDKIGSGRIRPVWRSEPMFVRYPPVSGRSTRSDEPVLCTFSENLAGRHAGPADGSCVPSYMVPWHFLPRAVPRVLIGAIIKVAGGLRQRFPIRYKQRRDRSN